MSSRAEARRKLRLERKENERAEKQRKKRAGITKRTRRTGSVRAKIQMLESIVAGTLIEVRNVVNGFKQRTDVHDIVSGLLCKKALGQELSEDDRAVLEDFIAEMAVEEPEPDQAPAEPLGSVVGGVSDGGSDDLGEGEA